MPTVRQAEPTVAATRSPARPRAGRVLYIAALAGLVACAAWLATIEIEGDLATFVARFGYAGYFIAACVAGINVVVPTTHLIFTEPLLDAGLSPPLLIACGALGATLADGVGYAIGASGRGAFDGVLARAAERLGRVVRRRPRLAPVVLFLWAAFAPLPNEVLVIPAGVVGYGVWRTALITLAGNLVFNTMAILLGLAVE